ERFLHKERLERMTSGTEVLMQEASRRENNAHTARANAVREIKGIVDTFVTQIGQDTTVRVGGVLDVMGQLRQRLQGMVGEIAEERKQREEAAAIASALALSAARAAKAAERSAPAAEGFAGAAERSASAAAISVRQTVSLGTAVGAGEREVVVPPAPDHAADAGLSELGAAPRAA